MSTGISRVRRLQEIMQEQHSSLAIISFTDQMRYLTGYLENGHKRLLALLIPAKGEPVFLVPSMNVQQAKQNPAGISHVVGWGDAEGWLPSYNSLLQEMAIPSDATILVDDELQSVHLMHMISLMPGQFYKPADDVLSVMRRIKTDTELEDMQTAASLIDSIAEEVMHTVRLGQTEAEVQRMVVDACHARSTHPSFTPLVCFGANGAMPHHSSDSTPLKEGDVVILDIGCFWNHYHSDITRTFSVGEPSDPEARLIYKVVQRAHMAARALAAPGISCEAVDEAARTVIESAGYGDYFIHRTGHGIGLSGHEPPYIVRGNSLLLEQKMCFSVEPGIYLPGRFGVRLEVIVTVEDEGVRSLNVDPPAELPVVEAR